MRSIILNFIKSLITRLLSGKNTVSVVKSEISEEKPVVEKPVMAEYDIKIKRKEFLADGTFGVMYLPNGKEYFTCECPKGEDVTGKCIPAGLYTLKLRYSPKVKSSSGGLYDEGWEFTEVEGRTYIMLHPANWPSELEGCVAPGLTRTTMRNKKGFIEEAVTNSRAAFNEIMEYLESKSEWQVLIED